MSPRFVLIASLFMAAPAQANDCFGAENPKQCALQSYETAHEAMMLTLNKLLESLDRKPAEQMRKAQQAWMAYRDTQIATRFPCDAENPRSCYGEDYPVHYHNAMKDLTQQRKTQLEQWLEKGLPFVTPSD